MHVEYSVYSIKYESDLAPKQVTFKNFTVNFISKVMTKTVVRKVFREPVVAANRCPFLPCPALLNWLAKEQ